MLGIKKGASWDINIRHSFDDADNTVGNREGSSGRYMKSGKWIVNKFGGTSVESAEAIRKVCDIVLKSIEDSTSRVAVVVSALGGNPKVTDLLLHAIDLAVKVGFEPAKDVLDGVYRKHLECIKELRIPWNDTEAIVEDLKSDVENICHVLKVVSLFKHETQVMKDFVSGYGEIWSGKVLCASLNTFGVPFSLVNARNNILIVDDTLDTGVVVDWETSNDRLRDTLSNLGKNVNIVITGFIACTNEGVATTLRRDGSDYSASIFGKLLGAKHINIWTDVDGIMSADPRLVPEARILDHVSYSEALELSYFGAKVIHQKALLPAALSGIPIYIRNTFSPLAPGTCIFYSSPITEGRPGCVCGISIVRDVSLINIEGTGMIGVPGISERLFHSLHAKNISVIFVSQASSELSITIAVKSELAKTAQACISNAFFTELSLGNISKVSKVPRCAIVTIVGDNIMHARNVSGQFFSALGRASINVIAIAQGSNQRNVSCVVSAGDSGRALKVVHAALIVPTNYFDIWVYGTDSHVGDTLMKLLSNRCSILNQRYKVNFRVRIIVDDATDDGDFIVGGCKHGKQQQKIKPKEEDNWKNRAFLRSKKWDCDQCQVNGDVEQNKLEPKGQQHHHLTAEVNNHDHHLLHALHSVVIDCTTSEGIPGEASDRHKKWLEAEMNVISNSPCAILGMLRSSSYDIIQCCNYFKCRDSGVKCLYGSILPVRIPILSTLWSLQAIEDRIIRIEFSMSIPLNHVMSLVSPVRGKSCSNSLQQEQMSLISAVMSMVKDQNQMWQKGTDATSLPGDDIKMWLLILGHKLVLKLENDTVQIDIPIPSCVYEKAKVVQQQFSTLSQSSAQDRKSTSVTSMEIKASNIDSSILFDDAIQAANKAMDLRVKAAEAKGNVLRHLAVIDVPSCSAWAKLCEVDIYDDFASVDRSTCCVRIEVQGTETPIVLKGPSMMPKDTADEMFSEITCLAQELGILHNGEQEQH